MDFRFDRDDQAMIGAVAEVFQRDFPVARLRGGESDPAAWREAGTGGWLHAGLAEADGGLGLPDYLLCAFAREAGRALLVDAWVNNALILPRLITGIKDAAHRVAWLARQREHPGYVVADGRSADLRGEPGGAQWCYGVEAGWDAYAVAGPHLVRTVGATVELREVGGTALGVGTVRVSGGTETRAEIGTDEPRLAAIARDAALVHSAALVGLAERAVAITVDYVKIREQFGRPVGQFQAPKHMLADALVLSEVAWNACLYAALRGASEPDSHPASRVQSVEAVLAATRVMLQLHGGMGFTWDSDVHLYLKTALIGASRFGAREDHALALGRSLLGAA
jgi:alkylation response protein AidB-like acyl-CoA dehydrogenase